MGENIPWAWPTPTLTLHPRLESASPHGYRKLREEDHVCRQKGEKAREIIP